MQTLRDCFTINLDGWNLSHLYDMAKARADDVLQQMIQASDTNEEKKEVKENCNSKIMLKSTKGYHFLILGTWESLAVRQQLMSSYLHDARVE